eukprot:3237303-Amphidinium_carterae.1
MSKAAGVTFGGARGCQADRVLEAQWKLELRINLTTPRLYLNHLSGKQKTRPCLARIDVSLTVEGKSPVRHTHLRN